MKHPGYKVHLFDWLITGKLYATMDIEARGYALEKGQWDRDRETGTEKQRGRKRESKKETAKQRQRQGASPGLIDCWRIVCNHGSRGKGLNYALKKGQRDRDRETRTERQGQKNRETGRQSDRDRDREKVHPLDWLLANYMQPWI